MEVKVNGRAMEFILEGPISEKTALYDYDIRAAQQIIVNMDKVTFINSIGVKNWILWTGKVPAQCSLELTHCPFVIVNQINMVLGFLPGKARVQSFYAPYISDSGTEMNVLFHRGKDYEYAQNGAPPKINIPESFINPKNQEAMEPDFILDKVTKFLSVTE